MLNCYSWGYYYFWILIIKNNNLKLFLENVYSYNLLFGPSEFEKDLGNEISLFLKDKWNDDNLLSSGYFSVAKYLDNDNCLFSQGYFYGVKSAKAYKILTELPLELSDYEKKIGFFEKKANYY